MNQKQLKYFLKVYESNSISEAARELYISPQGLSKMIFSLEAELQTQLFIHKSNRIIPTDMAAAFALHARNILNEYNLIYSRLIKKQNVRKLLSIPCSYDIPRLFPADLIHQFSVHHPDIRLQFHEYTDNDIISRLKSQSDEIAVLSGPLDTSLYHLRLLFTDSFCVLLHKSHPLASKQSISIADLNGEPMAVKDISSHTSLIQADNFLNHGFYPNIILETSDSRLILNMVEHNYAISIIAGSQAEKIHSDNISIRSFSDADFSKTIYLAYRNDSVLSTEAESFCNALFQFFPDTTSSTT